MRYDWRCEFPKYLFPLNYCFSLLQDFNDDIVGGMAIGMKGVLVKTGKYLPSICLEPAPTKVVENFSKFVELFENGLIS